MSAPNARQPRCGQDPRNAGQSYLAKAEACRNWRQNESRWAMRNDYRNERRDEHVRVTLTLGDVNHG